MPISGIENLYGWWTDILVTDIEGDGDMDIISGNHGNNLLPKVSIKRPIFIYNKDLDGNGKNDPLVIHYDSDSIFSALQHRDLLLQEVDSLKSVFTSHASYASASPQNILGNDFRTHIDTVNELRSFIAIQDDDHYVPLYLPEKIEVGAAKHISVVDFNEDGVKDILVFNGSSPLNSLYGKPDNRTIHIVEGGMIGGAWLPNNTYTFSVRGEVSSVCSLSFEDSGAGSYIVGFEDGKVDLVTIKAE
jgi:hypothetical protein